MKSCALSLLPHILFDCIAYLTADLFVTYYYWISFHLEENLILHILMNVICKLWCNSQRKEERKETRQLDDQHSAWLWKLLWNTRILYFLHKNVCCHNTSIKYWVFWNLFQKSSALNDHCTNSSFSGRKILRIKIK